MDSCMSNTSCEDMLVTMINKSQPGGNIILIQQDLSNTQVNIALEKALMRGTNVGIITNSRSYVVNYGYLKSLVFRGADIFTDDIHKNTNVFVIDNFYVITGTIQNSNLVIMHNPTIADVFVNEWVKHYKHSKVVN